MYEYLLKLLDLILHFSNTPRVLERGKLKQKINCQLCERGNVQKIPNL